MHDLPATCCNLYLRDMKLLLVTATPEEIQPLSSHFDFREGPNIVNGNEIFILVTGVGMVATAWSMGQALASDTFDFAFNAGIAGSFSRTLNPGDVVNVEKDCFSELGVQDHDAFLSIDHLGFGRGTEYPVSGHLSDALSDHLPKVSAITVNTVHGNEESIEQTVARLNPDIETMEGAAFFYCCRMKSLPGLQVRAVSNYVERRNRLAWNVPLAIANLNKELIYLLNKLV